MQRARWPITVLLFTAACGASPTAAPTTPPAPQLPDVAVTAATAPSLLQAAVAGPAPTDAVVTLAVFAPGAPARRADERARATVAAAFTSPSPARAADVQAVGAPPELGVVVAAVDPDLPLNLELLLSEAGPLRPRLEAAGQVLFVRYAGPTGADARPLRAAALAAAALGDALEGVVVDLSTFTTATPDDFVSGLSSAAWLDARIAPALEALDEKGYLLVLRTRGLARLGLPDLEMHGVARADLRARGERFRAVWDALRAHGFAKPGDVVGGATLLPCLGPPEAYDHLCVRVD
jgi:hypothetical protein